MKYKNNHFIADDIYTKKITYGFFSKEGGCSKGNYDSLNCSKSSGDNKKLVATNINIAKKKLGLEKKELKLIKQIHSNKIEIIDEKNLNEKIVADGSITKNKNIALAIMTADCAPIFIFDLDCSFICSLHIGWKGCLNNIVKTCAFENIAPNVFGALASAAPDRVQGFTGIPSSALFHGKGADGQYYNDHLFQGGGQGASSQGDGKSALLYPTSAANTSVELFETRVPVVVIEKALLPDSGGPGRKRGGLAQIVSTRKLSDNDELGLVGFTRTG